MGEARNGLVAGGLECLVIGAAVKARAVIGEDNLT